MQIDWKFYHDVLVVEKNEREQGPSVAAHLLPASDTTPSFSLFDHSRQYEFLNFIGRQFILEKLSLPTMKCLPPLLETLGLVTSASAQEQ